MLPRNHPDRIQITFDDRRLVANAGLLLPATLARHLGLPELVRQRLDLGPPQRLRHGGGDSRRYNGTYAHETGGARGVSTDTFSGIVF